MALPTVRTCIISDVVRPEHGGKFSLLGVYGVTPNVRIRLQPLPGTIALGFTLFCDFPTANETVDLRIEIPDIAPFATMRLELEVDKVPVVAVGLPAVRITRPGRYEFIIREGNREAFRGVFHIDHGTA